jgi:hypothetical protein
MENRELSHFQTVVQFVKDLSTEFGGRQHSLLLYNRLLDKTKVSHTDAIRRHLTVFSQWVLANRNAIVAKDKSQLREPIIQYSKKVNIKMDEIFRMADTATGEIIWKHLLVLLNGFDPASGAMDILKRSMEEGSNEGKFLNDLVGKIEKSVNPNTTDPMSAIMGMMTSGVFTDIVSSMDSGMKDGSLDLGKLFNTVQGMMGSMGMNAPVLPANPVVNTAEEKKD